MAEKRSATIWAWGAVFILLGLGLLIVGIAIDDINKAITANPNMRLVDILQSRQYWWNPLLDFVKTIGLALIAMGVFNIILDLPGWTSYFRSQLREVILTDS